MTTVELTISYYHIDFGGVEHIVTQDFETFTEAQNGAAAMLQQEKQDAFDRGAMMDTFYFSYDYLMDQSVAEDLGVEYTVEAA